MPHLVPRAIRDENRVSPLSVNHDNEIHKGFQKVDAARLRQLDVASLYHEQLAIEMSDQQWPSKVTDRPAIINRRQVTIRGDRDIFVQEPDRTIRQQEV